MGETLKELTPVEYGENAVKYLHQSSDASDQVCFRMHWHDRMELLWISSGSLVLYTDKGHREAFAGQLAVFGPGTLHGGNSGKDGVEYHTIMFDVEKFCNLTLASYRYLLPVIKREIVFPSVIHDRVLTAAVEKLVDMISQESDQHPLMVEAMIYQILGMLAKYGISREKSATKADSFCGILEYIDSHFGEKISAQDISKMFGYNETYFCRRFREVTGLNFSKYLQVTRMEYAMKLLRRGKEDIRYIAWKCGYPDASYFSNSFKKIYGFRPSEIYGVEDTEDELDIHMSKTEIVL